MKIVGLAVLRTGKDLQDAIPLVMANDLSSYGFFQRQVSWLLSPGTVSTVLGSICADNGRWAHWGERQGARV